ncbi:MAG TPA: hypothetical protein VGX51_03615 [Solirubrobacteraceae bacterium]|jgi:hypothetical protein|nr:hypothetical protein [Solirubrobacteraceae bacterium]
MSACAVEGGRATGLRREVGGERPKVLVLYESCPSGRRALAAGLELTDADGRLTVVTLAPQADAGCCSRGGTGEYNCAVREEAVLELREARGLAGAGAHRSSFRSLIEYRDPPLARWAAQRSFDVVLLARHRLTRGGHSSARKLRRATAGEVRVIA